jgi:hypothetical protein
VLAIDLNQARLTSVAVEMGEVMRKRKKEDPDPSIAKRMLVAEEEFAERVVVPFIRERNFAGASTAPDVMKHIATGAGSATQRSGKGGKSGGGMGGQQAGGIKGGGKRKTHAGRK